MGWSWKIQELYRKGGYASVGYKGGVLVNMNETHVMGFVIWPTFQRPDTTTGKIETGYGGGVFIPVDADETRVVMKAWNAVELTVRHELMEAFCYMGERVLDPHKTIDDLVYPHVLTRRNDEHEYVEATSSSGPASIR